MSRATNSYGPLNLGSFTTNSAGTWFTLPDVMDTFGLVLTVTSSLGGGSLQGSISTNSTEVFTLITTSGPIAFSTGGTPVKLVRFNSSQTSTESITAYATASV